MRFQPETKFRDGKYVFIRGSRDQEGINWVQVRVGNRRARHQKQSEYRGKGHKAIVALDEAGLNPTIEQFEEIKECVNSLNDFRSVARFVQPGWSGNRFALPDGEVISQSTPDHSIVGFDVRPNCTRRSGNHDRWLEHVATPLTGYHLPEFCLMLVFVAPLLRHTSTPFNFGFELAGPPATGKTTLAKVCASVAGPIGGRKGSYVTTMNATLNSLDASMPRYNDMPLILEEANLLTLSAGSAADRKYAELVFRLAEGRSKRRYMTGEVGDARFVWLATSNVGWPQLARNLDADTARAVADRMITLPILPAAQGGIYGASLKSEASVGALSRQVTTAAETHHGTSMRKFIGFLQQERQRIGARAFTARIDGLVGEYCNAVRARVEVDDRLMRAFGLVYAAGVIAQECGALPATFNPKQSTMRTLKAHLKARAAIKSPMQALVELACGDGALDLRVDDNEATSETIDDATCVIRETWRRVELILTADQLAKLEMEVPKILDDPQVAALLCHEDGRRTCYRHLVSLTRDRVYVVRYDELMAKAEALDAS